MRFSSRAGARSSIGRHEGKLYPLIDMKGKRRQEVIRDILRVHGSVDHVDALCLGVRFGVRPEVITEEVASVSEALKREAMAKARDTQRAQERSAELALAQKILRSGGA